MAKYDREFLVPYLEDICALHLSRQKLEGMMESSKQEIQEINQNALHSVPPAQIERYRTDSDSDGLGTGCLGFILCGLGLVSLFASFGASSPVALILPLMLTALGVYFSLKSFSAKDYANDDIRKRNEESERNHALAEMAALVVVEPKVNAVKNRIQTLEKEMSKIDSLLEKLYSVNVIPRWYRDLYPAVYLYDWFSNSRADDLDIALNTLVLEQIKDKLDVIIRNQGEMIVNQRVMIANQRRTMEQMELYRDEMLRKLNQIGASVEDQKMYLGMIEGNTAANAYFAAAYYLGR